MRYPGYLKYLHERALPRNPLWNPGNPKHRIFMPLYWLKMVQHRKPLPNDFVKFECHWQMTANDVRQYLEKLYNVKTLDVRIEIEKGKYEKHPKFQRRLAPPMDDRKFVYVQLKDTEFKFPEILAEADKQSESDEQLKIMESVQNKIKNQYRTRMDIGSWFS